MDLENFKEKIITLKANLKMIFTKDKQVLLTVKETNILDHFVEENFMDSEFQNSKMVIDMKDNFKKILEEVKAQFFIEMEMFFQENLEQNIMGCI